MRAYIGQWRERKGFFLVVGLYLLGNLAGPVTDNWQEVYFRKHQHNHRYQYCRADNRAQSKGQPANELKH